MPKINGVSLYNKIKEIIEEKDLKFYLITGHLDIETNLSILFKPLDLASLLNIVQADN